MNGTRLLNKFIYLCEKKMLLGEITIADYGYDSVLFKVLGEFEENVDTGLVADIYYANEVLIHETLFYSKGA